MTALLIGAGCFCAHLVLTLVLLRLPGRTSPVARHAASALVTHVLGVALAAAWLGPFPYWPVAAVSGFGAVCWLFAFSAVYKSVSLRILIQLARKHDHSLPLAAITEDYVWPEFTARCDVLISMGCATPAETGYEITAKGKQTARRIEAIQQACGIQESGMYSRSVIIPPDAPCPS